MDMSSFRSTLGEFEVIEADRSPSSPSSSSSGKFKSQYWHSYPFEKDDDLAERPWLRPEQIPTSFVDVNVIDVEKSRAMEGMTVKISKGIIDSIEKSRPADMQEDGWSSVDCKGLYMCPGLIDCEWLGTDRQLISGHVHIIEDVSWKPLVNRLASLSR